MIKRDEISDRDSCLNRADADEPVFILLARDAAAPFTIRSWAERRVHLGINRLGDRQIEEALNMAQEMEDSAAKWRQRAFEKLLRGGRKPGE